MVFGMPGIVAPICIDMGRVLGTAGGAILGIDEPEKSPLIGRMLGIEGGGFVEGAFAGMLGGANLGGTPVGIEGGLKGGGEDLVGGSLGVKGASSIHSGGGGGSSSIPTSEKGESSIGGGCSEKMRELGLEGCLRLYMVFQEDFMGFQQKLRKIRRR
jgi:hypothetical protein